MSLLQLSRFVELFGVRRSQPGVPSDHQRWPPGTALYLCSAKIGTQIWLRRRL